MLQAPSKRGSACLFARLRWTFLCSKREIEPEPAKTAKLEPESRLWREDRARLGQDLTYGQVRFDFPETERGYI